jgi:hypothetical protein
MMLWNQSERVSAGSSSGSCLIAILQHNVNI